MRDRRLLAVAALAAAWTLVVGAMTASGYSGNVRYLIVPAALAIVLAAAGIVLGLRALRAPVPLGRSPPSAWRPCSSCRGSTAPRRA